MCYVFIVLASFFMCACADNQTWFVQGNALYEQKAYDAALRAYQEIEPKNSVVWYNMGNVACQLKDYNSARLYWLRAQRYGDAQVFSESTKNLMFLAKQGFIDPVGSVYSWFWWLSRYVSIYIWQVLLMAAWYALCALLYKGYRSAKYISLLFISIVLSMIPIGIAYHAEQPRAIALEDITLYNGPNFSYYQIGSLPKGTMVPINQAGKEWCQISYNQQLAWVQGNLLAYI